MQRYFAAIILSTLLSALLGCASRSTTAPPEPAVTKSQEKKMEIKLESSAFKDGQSIPKQYTCDGVNISPPLDWSGVPKNGKTLAIICDDPDAPAGTWVHWVVYNLPADDMGLIENTPATDKLTGGGLEGKNDFGKIGYGGPCPPSGTHRYFFRLYALDALLELNPGAPRKELEKVLRGHLTAQTELMGTYSRPKNK